MPTPMSRREFLLCAVSIGIGNTIRSLQCGCANLKTDPLKILPQIWNILLGNVYLKLLLWMMTVFQLAMWLVKFYSILKTFQMEFTVKYCPGFLLSAIPVTCCPVLLWNYKLVEDIIEKRAECGWSLSSASEKLQRKLNQISSTVKYIMLPQQFISVGFIFLSSLWNENDEFGEDYFSKLLPEFAGVLIPIYRYTLFILTFCSTQQSFLLLFFCLSATFQIHMVNEKISEIHQSVNLEPTTKLPYEKEAQEEIFRRITLYMNHFLLWKKILTDKLKDLQTVPCLINLLNLPATSFGMFLYFFFTEAIYDQLKNIPWYSWNLKNQKILLNYMIQTTQPSLNISPVKSVIIKRVTIIKVLRMITSIAAVCKTIRDNKMASINNH
ncbi:uncharacterized protein isoform X2 [Leptinotarsa decemlineata]|uniref:uncharacterized protein isoform X2 n=1 Tax=Leptinotarsa decemlineata TaxID=7539 RepID=UPI003D30B87A